MNPSLRDRLPPLHRIAFFLLVIAVCAVAPEALSGYQVVFVLLTMLYVSLAYSWNLISGYTGYLSFGHVAFFGIGAYSVGILVTRGGWPWPAAVVAGGLVSAIVALPLGWVTLRLRGPYFAIAMLAVAEATRLVATVWRDVTRGGMGIFVSTSYNVNAVYYALLAVAVTVTGLTWWVDNSRFGLRLLAIREDEVAAETLGIDTTREKLVAFVLSAFFPGVIGGLYAWYIGYIDPSSVFAVNFSTNMILMTLLGGAGTFLGPFIGAAVFSVILESLWARFPEIHLMLSGLAIMAVVLFVPNGLVHLLQRVGLVSARRRFASDWSRSWPLRNREAPEREKRAYTH